MTAMRIGLVIIAVVVVAAALKPSAPGPSTADEAAALASARLIVGFYGADWCAEFNAAGVETQRARAQTLLSSHPLDPNYEVGVIQEACSEQLLR